MTPEQFRQAGIKLFGSERGWQSRLASELAVEGSTVSRWLSGTVPIPGPVQAAIKCWLSRKH